MRLLRSKFSSNLPAGKEAKIRKINEAEFLVYSKKEIGLLFAEAVTEQSHDKFSDIIELINNVCEKLNIDFYECMRVRTEKRFKEGKYEDLLGQVLKSESRDDT